MDRSATLPKLSTPYFNCLPHQIVALRKAMGWSRADLGTFVGACITENGTKCPSVGNWERGKYRPTYNFRVKLAQLARLAEREYLEELARAESVAASFFGNRPLSAKNGVSAQEAERTT